MTLVRPEANYEKIAICTQIHKMKKHHILYAKQESW